MNKIITAMEDEKINEKLRENNQYNVIGKDIQYQEGILEFMEDEKEINFLLLNSNLPGGYEIEELIQLIKKKNKDIKIILYEVYENEQVKKLFELKKIEKIITTEKELENFLSIGIKNKKQEELENEIKKLKEEISQIKEKTGNKEGVVLSFFGYGNVGKTSICFMFAKLAYFYKILLIDFDIEQKGLLRITDKEQKERKILQISKRISIVDGENLGEKYLEKIKRFREDYDLIIIDTNPTDLFQVNKEIAKITDYNILVVESNYLGIIKGNIFLNFNPIFTERKKIKILFNQFSKYGFNKTKLIKCFKDFPILGIIRKEKCYEKNINSIQKKYSCSLKEIINYQKMLDRVLGFDLANEIEWCRRIKKN